MLWIAGVPYAVALGLLVGAARPDPARGRDDRGGPVVLVAIAASGTTAAIIVAVFFVVYQQLENHLIQPLVYGRTVQLSPLAVLVSVLIGAQIAGVLGALAAIPVAGAMQVLLVDWRQNRSREAVATPAGALSGIILLFGRIALPRSTPISLGDGPPEMSQRSQERASRSRPSPRRRRGAAPRRHAAPLAPLEANVLVAINTIRAQHHLQALRLSSPLELAARAHSEQMAADGYFAHESADGSAFWRRVQSFYRSSPWRFWSVGENLLWSSPDIDAGKALKLWLASPEHRKNLLNPSLARDRRVRRACHACARRLPRLRRHGRDDRLRRPARVAPTANASNSGAVLHSRRRSAILARWTADTAARAGRSRPPCPQGGTK